MTGVNSFTSTYSMTLMSIDRYLAVCHPISSKSIRNPKMTKWIILGLWLFSFLLMIPLMIYGNLENLQAHDTQYNENAFPDNPLVTLNHSLVDPPNTTHITKYACMINWNMSGEVASHVFTFYNFALGFLFPVFIICILYPLVIIRLHNAGPKIKSQERRDSNRRITRLVLAIVIIFIILWLPYWVLQLYLIFGKPVYDHYTTNVIVYLNIFMLCLSYMNSAINPILYAFMSANFRGSFRQLLTGRQHRSYTLGVSTCQVPQETIHASFQKTNKQKNATNVIMNQPLINRTSESEICPELMKN